MSLIPLFLDEILDRRAVQLVINNKRVNIVTRSTIVKLIKLSIHHEVFFNLLEKNSVITRIALIIKKRPQNFEAFFQIWLGIYLRPRAIFARATSPFLSMK